MPSLVPSDIGILDLLRKRGRMTVTEFETALQVTATAVRQRLTRLMRQGFIERESIEAEGRGRPSHEYQLTREGRRQSGANFADLAVALWDEIRQIQEPEVRRGLLQRISARLAELYRGQISSGNLRERMESLAALFGERNVPFEVQTDSSNQPVLTALACPYPDLAERDRTVCAMERLMFSELLGERIVLDECRLDGGQCCTFRTSPASGLDAKSSSDLQPR